MVCETGRLRYRLHIIWPCLCWQKGGLDLRASSVLNHCILNSRVLSVGGLGNEEVAGHFRAGRTPSTSASGIWNTYCVYCILQNSTLANKADKQKLLSIHP